MKIKYFSFFFFALLISCTENMVQIGDVVIPDTERMVLLEELTGASCPNCPKGTASVEAILNKFPGKVAVVGIHGISLAQPIPNRSKYDFRNPKAASLETFHAPFLGKPAASVNRVKLEDNDLKSVTGQWQSMVEDELKKPHQLSIFLEAKVDEAKRILEIEATAVPLEKLDGSYNITVFITESKIIDAQINGSAIVDNFEHKHVLREIITKFDGDALATNMEKGQNVKRNYSFAIPNTTDGLWKIENLEIVVAIHKASGNDREVIQAAAKKLKG